MDTMLFDSRASMSMAPYHHHHHQGYHMSTQSSSTSTPSTSRSSQNVLNSRIHCNRTTTTTSFQPNQYPQKNGGEDTIMLTEGWTTCSLDDDDGAYIGNSETAGQFTEWVYPPADELDHEQREYHLSYDTEPEDDVPDSMVASSSSASASVFWSGSRSGVASTASTSVDSLGLHHVTLGSSGTDSPPELVYDKTNFATASESIWTHHELSELDITSIPPSTSGTLVNWKSPLASCCAMDDEDDIERLLGQKRPRDTELDELVERYKRRRTLPDSVWVQG